MAFTQFSYDMGIVAKLPDSPNIDAGLSAAQLKDKFDEGGRAIKTYINDTLLQEVAESPILFESVSVAASAFVADATHTGFPFRAAVALEGVTASMIPEVIFSAADAVGGVFAPAADSYDGGVYLYAAKVPPNTITIPTVVLWR